MEERFVEIHNEFGNVVMTGLTIVLLTIMFPLWAPCWLIGKIYIKLSGQGVIN
jgi:hypothetical protein